MSKGSKAKIAHWQYWFVENAADYQNEKNISVLV